MPAREADAHNRVETRTLQDLARSHELHHMDPRVSLSNPICWLTITAYTSFAVLTFGNKINPIRIRRLVGICLRRMTGSRALLLLLVYTQQVTADQEARGAGRAQLSDLELLLVFPFAGSWETRS
jgi:hypothetical protein